VHQRDDVNRSRFEWLQWSGEPWFLRWYGIALPVRWQGFVWSFLVGPLVLAGLFSLAIPHLNTSYGIIILILMFGAVFGLGYVAYVNTEFVEDRTTKIAMVAIWVMWLLVAMFGPFTWLPLMMRFAGALPKHLFLYAYFGLWLAGSLPVCGIWCVYLALSRDK
jgi:hypothetical protein